MEPAGARASSLQNRDVTLFDDHRVGACANEEPLKSSVRSNLCSRSFAHLAAPRRSLRLFAYNLRRESVFLFFWPQPLEKSQFGRIKPSKSEDFCLVLFGFTWREFAPWLHSRRPAGVGRPARRPGASAPDCACQSRRGWTPPPDL